MILGDFNLHHPWWGGEGAKADAEAEELLDIMETLAIDNWLPEGTITRRDTRSESTIDFVLVSTAMQTRMINCEVQMKVHTESDHFPIHSLVDVDTQVAEDPVLRRNLKAMDEPKLIQFVNNNLQHWHPTPGNTQRIEHNTEHLLQIVQQGIQATVPWARPSTFAKEG